MSDTKNLAQLLDEFERKGENMDSFEASHLNAQLMHMGYPPIAGRTGLVNIPSHINIHPNQGGGDKAQFDIIIQRNSANITATFKVQCSALCTFLPVILPC